MVCNIGKFPITIIAHYISRYDTYHDIQLITQLDTVDNDGCRTKSPTDLQHLCCKVINNLLGYFSSKIYTRLIQCISRYKDIMI